MANKKKEPFQYEDEPVYKPFDFINKELDFLFIIIFLEAFNQGRNTINFADFFKGNYWDIDDVADEITDTNDYYSISDMVMEQTLCTVPLSLHTNLVNLIVSFGGQNRKLVG